MLFILDANNSVPSGISVSLILRVVELDVICIKVIGNPYSCNYS